MKQNAQKRVRWRALYALLYVYLFFITQRGQDIVEPVDNKHFDIKKELCSKKKKIFCNVCILILLAPATLSFEFYIFLIPVVLSESDVMELNPPFFVAYVVNKHHVRPSSACLYVSFCSRD